MVSGRKCAIDRSLQRKLAIRQRKKRILVVTEGNVTEPRYFKAFQHAMKHPLVHVEIVGAAADPSVVVQQAIDIRNTADQNAKNEHDDNLKFDESWVVFDRDSHDQFDNAKRDAQDMAVSNPCFELWALLHFEDQCAHIERDKVREKLKTYMPRYEKELDYDLMSAGYVEAWKRAQQLDEQARHHAKVGENPTTGVYFLTESIRLSA